MKDRVLVVLSLVSLIGTMLVTGCGSNEAGGRRILSSTELSLASRRLPIAIRGQAYAQAVQLAGGTPPYTWTVRSTSVPPGIAVEGADVQLDFTGTPTTNGPYTVAVLVTDAAGDSAEATFGIHVADEYDLTGTWAYSIEVTREEGVCSGEVGQGPSVRPISIAQTPAGAPGQFDVVLSGFMGDPGNTISGTITNWSRLVASGSYPEDGGTTTTTHMLTIFSPTEIGGDEAWTWAGEGGTCPNGEGLIEAVKTSGP